MKEIVKKLLEQYTKEQLAARFQVSVRTIERWCEGTQPRPRDARRLKQIHAKMEA